MTKNITVVDEENNILESTYPKRAKGLVKHNRARWIDDTTICLFARPDNKEETKMANSIYEIFDNQISKMQDGLQNVDSEQQVAVNMQILKTMEVFRAQEQGTKILDMVKAQLDFLKDNMSDEIPEMNMESPYQPTAVEKIVVCRETTKQKIIALTEKLLDIGTAQESPSKPMNTAEDNMGRKISEAVNSAIQNAVTTDINEQAAEIVKETTN